MAVVEVMCLARLCTGARHVGATQWLAPIMQRLVNLFRNAKNSDVSSEVFQHLRKRAMQALQGVILLPNRSHVLELIAQTSPDTS